MVNKAIKALPITQVQRALLPKNGWVMGTKLDPLPLFLHINGAFWPPCKDRRAPTSPPPPLILHASEGASHVGCFSSVFILCEGQPP